MNDIYPRVPDVEKILKTAKTIKDEPVKDFDNDEYVQFLVMQGVFSKETGVYNLNDKYFSLCSEDEAEARYCFQKLISVFPIYNDFVNAVAEGNDSEIVIQKMEKKYSHQDVMTVLEWLANLNILIFKNGKYIPSTLEAEYDDENIESVYPMDIVNLDIKEGKFSVYEYLRKVNDGRIILNPDFQRNKVWKNEQKSKFIESTMLNIPIPPLYFKEDQNGRLIIIDGLQRTSALKEFMDDKFALKDLQALKDLNGLKCSALAADEKTKLLISRIEDKQLPFYNLAFNTPMQVVYDIFNRINTGGTKLERQEVRNCIFIGKSTQLLKDLAAANEFTEAINYGISSARMKDREAVLRCLTFTLLDYKADYKGSMDSILEKSMRLMNRMNDEEIGFLKNEFLNIMKITLSVFGDGNFRIPTDYTCGRINIALMESVYYAFYKLIGNKNYIINKQIINEAEIDINKKAAVKIFRNLLKNPNYIDSVRNSTASQKKVETRFSMAEEAFKEC